MSFARSYAAAGTFWLLGLQWAWRGLHPTGSSAWWVGALVFSLPLLPPAIAFVLGRPRAPLWAGIVALLYFCHGIAEWRASPGQWGWAATETALAVAVVMAAGWPGIAAKIAKRRAASPPNV